MPKTYVSIFAFLIAATISAQEHKVHHIVIEVDVRGTIVYQSVLSHTVNLRKAFAPDEVQIEVVCHGPGIDMVIAKGNPLGDKIQKAQKAGVVFAACHNTMNSMHLKPSQLIPSVQVTPSGAAEVVRKQEAGWAYLKM